MTNPEGSRLSQEQQRQAFNALLQLEQVTANIRSLRHAANKILESIEELSGDLSRVQRQLSQTLTAAGVPGLDHPHSTKSVADLRLTIRSRKAMNGLAIGTIGQLTQRSAEELLEVKQFGETSLQEVREKLGALGLKLWKD